MPKATSTKSAMKKTTAPKAAAEQKSHPAPSKQADKEKTGAERRREKRIPSSERHIVIPDGNEYPLLLDVVNTSKRGVLVHAANQIKNGTKVMVIARSKQRFSISRLKRLQPFPIYTVRWCAKMEKYGFFWGLERVP